MSTSVPASNRPFRYRLRVRFEECDPQRVVFNARYGVYVDLAVLEFFRAQGLAGLLVKGPFDYQLVKQSFEWKSPARFDDVLEISVRAIHQGNTSFSLRTEMRQAADDALVVVAETIYVLIDAQTFEKRVLPDEMRIALERGGRGLVVDHADCTPRSE